MEQEKLNYFRKRLEDERKLVEGELKTLGVEDKNSPGGWDATSGEIDQTATEADELADRQEEYEENHNEVDALEVQLHNVVRALGKLEEGKYGVCEISAEPIEVDRLEANPSARTCKRHMDGESSLPQ